jgi:hypothetical protein
MQKTTIRRNVVISMEIKLRTALLRDERFAGYV